VSDALRIVYMGDSITFGQYLDPADRWSTAIDARLGELDPPVEIETFNRGISGETTRQGLERFATDVQALRPHVMTLQFGLNDCNCWDSDEGLPRVSERAFSANLVEMIERARRFGALEIVLATNHRTLKRKRLPSGEIYEDRNERYSELTRAVAKETAVELCDVQQVFAPFSDEELERLVLPFPDQLHLSPEGNSVYADAIWPFVRAAVERVAGERPLRQAESA
jgi:lysophospholipase L1-like esterase